DRADGKVHEERPSPTTGGDDRGSQRRSRCHGERTDATPERHHLRAPLSWIRADEQRNRRRNQERRTDALEYAAGDERSHVRRDPAEQRARKKDGDTGHERAPPTETITGSPADDEQRSEDD